MSNEAKPEEPKSEEPKFTIQTRVKKPVAEVFDAVYNPRKLDGYFTRGASAPLDAGTTVYWNFPEFEEEDRFPVIVKETIPNELIAFEWEGVVGKPYTRVEIRFQALDEGSTLVSITETGWGDDEESIKSSYRNCQGWQQMSSSLKVFVEHGISLRDGVYIPDTSIYTDPGKSK